MKKKIVLFTILSINVSLFSQDLSGALEGNNVRATISNTGLFFNDIDESRAGYESPKDEGNHLLYSTSFWFGAKDESGNIKMAANLYGGEYRDTYPGALKNDGTAEAPDTPYADEIYFVSKAEIEYHVANYYDPDYVTPHGIASWPAHGDVGMGMDDQLAPFADLNGNGIYEPESGEYPEIRGDHAAYLIMNDMAGPHTQSGGDPLGIEIHYMFYQYNTEYVINNTTFINVRVINRSSNNYPEFITSAYMRSYIGHYNDDYIGCNPAKNYMFGYNSDNVDEAGGLDPGYGENPPAVGFLLLNHDMHVSGYFAHATGPFGVPNTAADFWNYQNAIWKNGSPFQFGGNGNTTGSGEPTNFMYPSDPTLTEPDPDVWSERSEVNPGGSRRMHMSAAPISLAPGEVICYDFAVMTSSREGDNYENASSLADQADDIHAFYDMQPDLWCDFTLGISEETPDEIDFRLFPNPASGMFTIDFEGSYQLQLFTMDGQLIFMKPNSVNKEIINVDLNSGIYLVRLVRDGKVYQNRLVVN